MSALEVLAEAILNGSVSVVHRGEEFAIHVHNGADRVAEMYHAAASADVEQGGEAFLDHCRALEPADKIAALEAMGFSPVGSDHRGDCPYVMDAGLNCNCVPDPTMWIGPTDVQVHMGDTWDERKKRAGRPIPAVERY